MDSSSSISLFIDTEYIPPLSSPPHFLSSCIIFSFILSIGEV